MGIGEVLRDGFNSLWQYLPTAQKQPSEDNVDQHPVQHDSSDAHPISPLQAAQAHNSYHTRALQKRRELELLANQFAQNQIDIDSVLPKLLSLLCKYHTDHLQLQKRLLLSEERYGNEKEEDQVKLHEKVLDEQNNVGVCNKVHKGVAAGGFAACAASSLIAGTAPLPVALLGIGYGLLLTIDTIADDVLKKQIASFIAQGDKESEATWLSRIELFTSLTSFALSFGFNPTGAVNTAIKVAELSLGFVKGTMSDRLNQLQGNLKELEHICEKSDGRKEEFREALVLMMKDVHYFWDIYKREIDSQNQTAKTVNQRGAI